MTSHKNSRASFKVCEKEYDSPELGVMIDWLKQNGWSFNDKNWNRAGSQEIASYKISKGEAMANLVFEAYMGVTLFVAPEHQQQFNAIRIAT